MRILALALVLAATIAPSTSEADSYRSRLGVVGREWSLSLSRASVASPVMIEYSNFGEDRHNLWLRRGSTVRRTPTIEPGDRVRRQFRLARGTWTVYCELPGHSGRGMRTTLRVR